jgi:hypothetical protein
VNWRRADPTSNNDQRPQRPPPYPAHARSADYAPVSSRGGPRHGIWAKTPLESEYTKGSFGISSEQRRKIMCGQDLS